MAYDSLNSKIIVTPLIYIINNKLFGETRIHDDICFIDNYYNSQYSNSALINYKESFYLTANSYDISGQEFYKIAEPFISQYSINRPRKLYDIPGEYTLTINGQFFIPVFSNNNDTNPLNIKSDGFKGSLAIFDFIYCILFGMECSAQKNSNIISVIINYINIPGHTLPTNYWLLNNVKITIEGNSESVATWSLTFTSLARNFLNNSLFITGITDNFIPTSIMDSEKTSIMRTMRTRDFYVNIFFANHIYDTEIYNILPLIHMDINASINWEKKATNFSYYADKEDPFLLNRYFSATGVSCNISLGFIGELENYKYLAGFTSQNTTNLLLSLNIYAAGTTILTSAISKLLIVPKVFTIKTNADSFIECNTNGNIIGMNNILKPNIIEFQEMTMV